jgi:hypothetical protein
MRGAMLLGEVNLFCRDLTDGLHAAIADRTFADFRSATKDGWAKGDGGGVNCASV